jgi:glycosyltransferase involved in cell wall biosynthesis
MKKMKVYMQFPLMKSDSQYYKSILDHPPKDIIYRVNKEKPGMISDVKKFERMKKLKKFIRVFFNKTGFPFPSAFYVKNAKQYDLIHCAHCLCLNNKPWVADIELAFQMWGGVKLTPLRKFFVKKLILSKNCKKIIPWTEEARNQILKEFPEVKNKLALLPHAIPIPKIKKKKSKDITLLFTGRYFFQKGGLHTLEAMDRLTKKYPKVNAIIISEIPKEILRKYKNNKKIEFRGLTPFDKIMNDIYPRSDIFICPGYTDSFGFPFIEAQSLGIPVVTVDGLSRRELIQDGKTGFVISSKKEIDYNAHDEEIVKKLVKKTSLLIENEKLRKKMSLEGKKIVREGKFSIKERNKKLKKIYLDALK